MAALAALVQAEDPLQVNLSEWVTTEVPGVSLTDEGRALAERLGNKGLKRLEIDELREGLRIRARSWVGVVRVDGLEIRIHPKLAGDQIGLVRLLELVAGVEGLSAMREETSLESSGDSLIDLLVLLFTKATEQVVRRGLLAGYREQEDVLTVARGRILADRQLLKRFGQIDRIHCRFDEHDHDVVENRVLLAALQVVHRRVSSETARRRAVRMRSILEPVCSTLELDLARARQEIVYNRLNSHYERAHTLAWLLLDGFGIEDLLAPGSMRSFAFLLDMNRLFERFVEILIRWLLPASEFRIRSQAVERSVIWNTATDQPYGRVIPDLAVESRERDRRRVAIDAKYKLYDERRLDPADVYQTFLYAYALGEQPIGRLPAAIILYPSTDPDRRPERLRIRNVAGLAGAEILAISVDIVAALDEMEGTPPGDVLGGLEQLIRSQLMSESG